MMAASKHLRSLGLCLALTLLLLSCSKRYVVVEYLEKPPDAPLIRELRRQPGKEVEQLITVAILFPPDCILSQVAKVEQSSCAPWIQPVVVALSKAGFQVVSPVEMAVSSREQALAPYAAAQSLGATHLITVNRLVTDEELRRDTTLRYYRSNQVGDKLEPEKPTAALQQFVSGYLHHTRDVRKPSLVRATIELVAAETTSGKNIWSYSASRIAAVDPYVETRLLLRGRDEFWRPVAPLAPARVAPFPKKKTARSVLRARLIGALATDLAHGFQMGQVK